MSDGVLMPFVVAMENIARTSGDPEADHGAADDLLLDAIDAMADAGEQSDGIDAKKLRKAFDRLEKWYA